MRRLVLGALVLVGCDPASHPSPPDATPPPGPCETGTPGVRVHLTFDAPYVEVVTWNEAQPLALTTTGAEKTSYALAPGLVDAARHAVVAVAYPSGTVSGPARAAFDSYAGGGLDHWGGTTDFTADPAVCVEVDLDVHFSGEHPDAGIDAAP
jgi:hypothetical protein